MSGNALITPSRLIHCGRAGTVDVVKYSSDGGCGEGEVIEIFGAMLPCYRRYVESWCLADAFGFRHMQRDKHAR